MADPSALLTPSATSPNAGAQVAALQTEAVAEVLAGNVSASTLSPEIGAILSQLQSGIAPSAGSVLGQLSGLSEPISVFVQQLQQSIATAKEGTTQGLFLAQQLQQGVITTAQFQSALSSITLTPAQLSTAVASNVNTSVTQLLGSLAAEAQLNSLAPLLSKVTIPSPPTVAKIGTTATPAAPAGQVAIATADTDTILSGELPPHQAPLITTDTGQASDSFSGWQAGSPSLPLHANWPNGISPTVVGQLSSDKNQEILSFFSNLFKTAADIAVANAKASLSSFASLRAQPRIMTGARAVIRINGAISALCTHVSYEINTDWAEIKGVDEMIPNDLVPMAFSVRGNMGIYRIPNGSPINKFLTQDMFQGIIWPYTTIEIRDKRTDELILLLKRCAITSQSESYRKGELTVTNLSFVSIGMRDEHIPQLLPDKLPKDEQGDGGLLGVLSDIKGKLGF